MLSRIAALSRTHRGLVLRAACALAWYRVALAFLPVRSLAASRAARQSAAPAGFTPAEAAWAVRAVANRIPGTRCLARALALRSLLRRAGFEAELRMGVRLEDGRLLAHAWIDCGAQALDDDPQVALRYAAFEGPIPYASFSA
jgi:hypothetical protein